jgi:hypothetical protein
MSPALRWLRDRIVSLFEESPGVMSSTRLVMVALTVFAGIMTLAIRAYLLRAGRPDAAVIGAAATVITAILGGLAYVTGKRGDGT